MKLGRLVLLAHTRSPSLHTRAKRAFLIVPNPATLGSMEADNGLLPRMVVCASNAVTQVIYRVSVLMIISPHGSKPTLERLSLVKLLK